MILFQILSKKLEDAMKRFNVENHSKFKDFSKKVEELVNKSKYQDLYAQYFF